MLPDTAALFTDGRYYIQAEAQLAGSTIELMKSGQPGVPTIEEYLYDHLEPEKVVGFDGRTVSLDFADRMLGKLGDKKVTLNGDLDLFGDDPQFERQQWLLDEQLKLAKRYDLPVILHSRRTHDKLAMHLKRHDLPCTGVVHGFSGSLQQAERFVQLGYKIGVGGTITYPRASKTRDVIAKLPLASLLLETDAPDMPLNGFQGQPNRPEQAVRVFDVLCELRPEPEDEIAEVLLNNTYALFSVSG